MSAWQPIATAPRDGTQIIVSDGTDAWLSRHFLEELYSHGELRSRREGWRGPFLMRDVTPTHWMELPQPPLIDKGEA